MALSNSHLFSIGKGRVLRKLNYLRPIYIRVINKKQNINIFIFRYTKSTEVFTMYNFNINVLRGVNFQRQKLYKLYYYFQNDAM